MVQEVRDFLGSKSRTNLIIVLLNVIIFIITKIVGDPEDLRFMLYFGASYTPYILDGEVWRLLTSMFLHFGILHLLYNMIVLVSMGDVLEEMVGSFKFLMIYLLGGILGNVASLVIELYTGKYAVSAGASGAVFAVIGAILIITVTDSRRVSSERIMRMMIMVALMIIQGFTEAGTDNAAHVGGLVAGVLLGFLLRPRHQS